MVSLKMSAGEQDPLGDRVLLVVDDEENILASLRRLFRRDGLEVLVARSAREGLQVLANRSVGVIVSDQRMPEMSGVEFLRVVKQRFPDTVRIVLSGYTDLQSVTDAINEGAIYKFLSKPWDDDQLRANVNEAFERYFMKQDNLRLNRQLTSAVDELSRINDELELRVEEKTRELTQNLQSLRLAQAVLEHLPAAVFGLCENNRIAVANRAAYARFAHPGVALLGEPFGEVVPPLLADTVRRLRERFAADGSSEEEDVPALGRVICAPLVVNQAGVEGWVVVVGEHVPGAR